MRPVVLSERLRAVTAMVTPGNRVCDVGCDHGFVSIYLIEQGISPHALAMDVREGPLGAASGHVAERGLEDTIETRLSDGLHKYKIGEADTLICAGMGGGLMMRILSEEPDKTESFRELILQPQSEIEKFRAWLCEKGYQITDENMVEEDGKFYPMVRVELCKPVSVGSIDSNNTNNAHNEMCDEIHDIVCTRSNESCAVELDEDKLCKLKNRYGAILLRRKDTTLAAYLRREERIYTEILDNLCRQGLSDEQRRRRYTEVSELLDECRMALAIAVFGKVE